MRAIPSSGSPSSRPSRSRNSAAALRQEVRMTIIRRLGFAVAGFALASVPLAAHHSFAMFDMDKNIEYQGTISEWKWQNPHVHFIVDVKPGPGVDPAQLGRW